MSQPPSPLSREDWKKVYETLVRGFRGEAVPANEVPDGQPDYNCRTCQDTAFVLTTRFDGIVVSARCGACKPRVDAEIARRPRAVPDIQDIPDQPAPKARDWKKLTGLDNEED
jgi:hypothetical protein